MKLACLIAGWLAVSTALTSNKDTREPMGRVQLVAAFVGVGLMMAGIAGLRKRVE